MKHHEYRLYRGGSKQQLPNIFYCEDCHMIIYDLDRKYYLQEEHKKQHKKNVPSHKKQKGKPLPGIKFNLPMRNSAYENV